MKLIIDFIEDVRESIGNRETFLLTAMLVKEDKVDTSKLIYVGESAINSFNLDTDTNLLNFKIDGTDSVVSIGDIIPSLLVLAMDSMMYELRMNVNANHNDVEIIGFGKNEEESKYILFIKL